MIKNRLKRKIKPRFLILYMLIFFISDKYNRFIRKDQRWKRYNTHAQNAAIPLMRQTSFRRQGVTCTRCGYTELYKGNNSDGMDIIDFLIGG